MTRFPQAQGPAAARARNFIAEMRVQAACGLAQERLRREAAANTLNPCAGNWAANRRLAARGRRFPQGAVP